MLTAPHITFKGLSRSAEIEADILERLAWLERFYAGIVSCRVVIEVPHRHRRTGRHFHVAIEVTVPSGEAIAIRHEPSLHSSLRQAGASDHPKHTEAESVHRYARIAIHDAFDAARRRLEDFARRQRGAVKLHAVRPARTTGRRAKET